MINKHETYLKKILQNIDDKGYLRHRESSTIEFKENFNFSNMPKHSKTMAAFANNRGGYIIFGVKDSPRKLIGINKEKFDNIKQERISTFLIDHFDPEIKWDMGIVENEEKYFGYIYIYESEEKPIICKKNAGNNDIQSGEIYFRYRGQSRKIGFSELKKIIDEFREKERKMWMSHIERIARIGPSNVAILDMLSGDLHVKEIEGAKLVMDRNLIDELRDKVRFVEEGKFSKTEGEPTLKIVGEIQTADVVIPLLDPNKDYPYLQKHLAEHLELRPYDVQVLIWKYNIKGDRRYHIEVETSKSGKVHKYSRYALDRLKNVLKEQKDVDRFLKKISKEYQTQRRHSR
ncbi:MAG: putative DNA binding domain-containing protein [Candidatus Desulfofervidaceae bacterium]|nr:putative DNA binding domain-containing protein [Candidatus Desulfofervidaceae bacterium]